MNRSRRAVPNLQANQVSWVARSRRGKKGVDEGARTDIMVEFGKEETLFLFF
jgi:hypothetical protein